MYQKFIINQDGILKFGRVYLHKDLLSLSPISIKCATLTGLASAENPYRFFTYPTGLMKIY